MPTGYNVLSSTDIEAIVSVNEKTSYTLSKSAFDLCRLAISGGGDAETVFASMATVTAKSVKAFDPVKAAEKAKREKIAAAVVLFNTKLAEHTWSQVVDDAAIDYQMAKSDVEEAKNLPMPELDLNVLRRLDGKLAVNDTEVWSYREISRGGSKFFVYEVMTTAPADHSADVAMLDAKSAFQIACHSEALDLADTVLSEELKVTSFDLNSEGNVIYTAKVKAARGGNGGGPRKRVEYVDEGNNVHIFESKRELGEHLGATSKYPHASKEVRAAFNGGHARLLD